MTLTRNQEGFLKKVIRKYFRVNAIRNMAIQAISIGNWGGYFIPSMRDCEFEFYATYYSSNKEYLRGDRAVEGGDPEGDST